MTKQQRARAGRIATATVVWGMRLAAFGVAFHEAVTTANPEAIVFAGFMLTVAQTIESAASKGTP